MNFCSFKQDTRYCTYKESLASINKYKPLICDWDSPLYSILRYCFWGMIYAVLYKFLHILPTKLFGLFWLRTVPFANHSKFYAKTRHQSSSTISFENFQIATHGFLGFQFLEKCRTLHFGQFLTHPKKL